MICVGQVACAQMVSPTSWTDTDFPLYIERLTHFGERPDWSPDGKRLLFLEKMYGDVFEIELATGVIRPLTHHYFHNGYTRALYLANGDILLSGSKAFNPEAPHDSRFRTPELWVLNKSLDKTPGASRRILMGRSCRFEETDEDCLGRRAWYMALGRPPLSDLDRRTGLLVWNPAH